jgi:hypothetical protein
VFVAHDGAVGVQSDEHVAATEDGTVIACGSDLAKHIVVEVVVLIPSQECFSESVSEADGAMERAGAAGDPGIGAIVIAAECDVIAVLSQDGQAIGAEEVLV